MDFEDLERFDPLERGLARSMRIFGVLLALCVFCPIALEGEGFVKLFDSSGHGFSDLLPGYYTAFAGVALLVLSFLKLSKDIKGIVTVALLLLLPLILGVNLFELKETEQLDALRQLNIVWKETNLQTTMLLAGVVAAAAGMSMRDHHPKLPVARIVLGAGVGLVLAYFFVPTDAGTPLLLAIDKVKLVTSTGFEATVYGLMGPAEGAKMVSQMKLQVFLRFAFYLIPVLLMLLSLPALLMKAYKGKRGGGNGAIVAWGWRLFIPAVYFPMAIKMGLMMRSGDVFLAYARMYLVTVAVLVTVPTALDAILSHYFAPNRGVPDLAEDPMDDVLAA